MKRFEASDTLLVLALLVVAVAIWYASNIDWFLW